VNLLDVQNLSVTYSGIYALRSVNITAERGSVVSVVGPNGAGKTTLLRAISGLVKSEPNSKIFFKEKDVIGWPAYKIANLGIAHVPEGRQIFSGLSVNENLEIACGQVHSKIMKSRINEVYELFSELATRKNQLGGSLSGGEQQMLAIGRALASNSEIIMVDEPSMGLAPIIVLKLLKTLTEIIQKKGLTLLLVEQNTQLALPLSNYIYVLAQGQVSFHGTVEELKNDKKIRDLYFAKK
jgi:branched-chain amino acid transport system ATP-binding protein